MSSAPAGWHAGDRPVGGRGPRLFVTRVEEPRSRRATDVLLLASAIVGIALLSLVALPPAGFERALIGFTDRVPRGLAGIWQLGVSLLTLFALGIVVATLAYRRWSVLRDLVLGVVVSLVAAAVLERVVHDSWPAVWPSLRGVEPSAWFAPLRLAVTGTVVMTASPHLTQPIRRVGRWLLIVGAVALVLLGVASPTAAAVGLLVAAASAATVHLWFGSSRGRPSLADVALALDSLGVQVRSLGIAARQRTGAFLVDATSRDGDRLLVKVYGRDASDTQLLTVAWRTVWYREAGAPRSPRRREQVEHEAFLTLLAGQAGIATQGVVTAGTTGQDDVLLVLQPIGDPLDAVPDRWSEARVPQVWAALRRLHDAGIAHGQVDDRHLVVDGDEVGLIDFGGATVAPTEQQLRTDEAQALVTTALAVGPAAARHAALDALGTAGLAAVLPFVQPSALTSHQRGRARQDELDLDELRDGAAELAGVPAPDLQKMRRVTWSSVLQVLLLLVAFLALASGLAGIDLEHLVDQLNDASWWFIAVGVVLAQTPRLAQAVSTLGASPTPVPLGPLYALQLASSYLSLAVPTSAARIAINVRFFQRHGLPTGSALAVGALDGVSGFIVQAGLLASILLLTPASLDLDLEGTTPSGLVRLVAVIVALGLVGIAAVVAVPGWRRRVLAAIRQLATEAMTAVRGLRSPRRVGMLFGGNLASELLFASALGAFTASLGYPVGLTELVLINVSVSLLAGILPIPGGIGVVEGGLTLGLVRAGIPEETAFAAVLMYRLATFYLPPVWGFFALRWLERNAHL